MAVALALRAVDLCVTQTSAATGGHQRDLGQLKDPNGNTIVVPGLWSLEFGSSGGASGNANELYFTAGPNGYADGLFGKFVPAPLSGGG